MLLENLPVQSYILYKPDFLHPLDQNMNTVTLERRSQTAGPDKWGIYKAGSVLYKSEKEFGYESMPSSRTPESLGDTRFSSAEEAYTFWETEVKNKFEEDLQFLKDLYSKASKIKHN